MRRGGGLLQHGSILIEPRIETLRACLRLPEGGETIEDGVAGLAELGLTQPARIAGAIGEGFAARFDVNLGRALLRPQELAAAKALAMTKYHSADWTQRLAPAIT
jgi:lipoate-protein ligase A